MVFEGGKVDNGLSCPLDVLSLKEALCKSNDNFIKFQIFVAVMEGFRMFGSKGLGIYFL